MAGAELRAEMGMRTRSEPEMELAFASAHQLSNPEIGAQLYLSARTAEWHLREVFAKLEIGSRRQLQQALPE
jgi:ATP/maltotriose-dependent transcriptional regulator MalT